MLQLLCNQHCFMLWYMNLFTSPLSSPPTSFTYLPLFSSLLPLPLPSFCLHLHQFSYYSVSIFCKVGADGFIGTVVLYMVLLISQFLGALIVDKVFIVYLANYLIIYPYTLQIGRKPLLLVGAVLVGILLVATGTLVQLFDLEKGEDLNKTQRIISYLVIVLVCLLMSIYVVSLA